jgi:hypothetical protein
MLRKLFRFQTQVSNYETLFWFRWKELTPFAQGIKSTFSSNRNRVGIHFPSPEDTNRFRSLCFGTLVLFFMRNLGEGAETQQILGGRRVDAFCLASNPMAVPVDLIRHLRFIYKTENLQAL